MITSSEEKLTESFIKAFKEVVEPGLDSLSEKVDGLVSDMKDVEKRLDTVVIKLSKIDDRLDRHGKFQEDLQERIEVLEASSI